MTKDQFVAALARKMWAIIPHGSLEGCHQSIEAFLTEWGEWVTHPDPDHPHLWIYTFVLKRGEVDSDQRGIPDVRRTPVPSTDVTTGSAEAQTDVVALEDAQDADSGDDSGEPAGPDLAEIRSWWEDEDVPGSHWQRVWMRRVEEKIEALEAQVSGGVDEHVSENAEKTPDGAAPPDPPPAYERVESVGALPADERIAAPQEAGNPSGESGTEPGPSCNPEHEGPCAYPGTCACSCQPCRAMRKNPQIGPEPGPSVPLSLIVAVLAEAVAEVLNNGTSADQIIRWAETQAIERRGPA
jgi:hypothetical protein